MSDITKIVSQGLWNTNITPEIYSSKEQYQQHLFEQYKLYVDSADQISTRRNVANSLFITLHTLILGSIGFAYEKGPDLTQKWILVFPVLAVLALCYLWWRLIKSYQQLNTAKFIVIREYEKRLPTQPYWEAEWEALGKGQDYRLYRPLTGIENGLPWFFMALYTFTAISIWFFT